MRFDLSGFWSRQINKKDRLVYRIEDNIVTVTIVSAKGHYGDK
ncbi:type II toxin-antitoxin system YoeB family toxin [uncultured Mucilaginibacter sp.]|nr:type II toxin-antitoxin system YoeB family toxin [uncultured Mucilaginibacter sp.]